MTHPELHPATPEQLAQARAQAVKYARALRQQAIDCAVRRLSVATLRGAEAILCAAELAVHRSIERLGGRAHRVAR